MCSEMKNADAQWNVQEQYNTNNTNWRDHNQNIHNIYSIYIIYSKKRNTNVGFMLLC